MKDMMITEAEWDAIENGVTKVRNALVKGNTTEAAYSLGTLSSYLCEVYREHRQGTMPEEFIEESEFMLARPGTFEWVLARIRLGEKPEKFRRCCWPSGYRLAIRFGDMLWIESEPGSPSSDMQVSSFDILATDWEESE